MNTLFIFIPLLIITCFFLIGWTTNLPNQIQIGQKAPLFELYNQNEELVSLEQYLGKKVVIYFFPRTFTKEFCIIFSSLVLYFAIIHIYLFF